MSENLESLDKQIADLQQRKEGLLKNRKTEDVRLVKELILKHEMTKGDLRGKAMKQLLGSEYGILYKKGKKNA